jgi:hypothetical protein
MTSLSIVLSTTSVLGACATEPDEATPGEASYESRLDPPDPSTPADGPLSPVDTQDVVIPNPDGVYFASITANGTGCPRGTWEVNIDPAGETFTLTFSQYETMIDPGKLISIRDCQIGVKLHSPQGLSYSVSDFFYSGFAFLDRAGMLATQTAGYYFQGNPVVSVSARTDLAGPFNDSYIFSDQIGIVDLVWSPCGTDRMLNIPTRLIAKNNTAKTGTGYLNTLAVDGSVVLQFSLQWRTCP